MRKVRRERRTCVSTWCVATAVRLTGSAGRQPQKVVKTYELRLELAAHLPRLARADRARDLRVPLRRDDEEVRREALEQVGDVERGEGAARVRDASARTSWRSCASPR